MDSRTIFADFLQGRLHAFYREYYPGFVVYAERFLGGELAYMAQDIVQDTVIKAWYARERFDHPESLRAFIYTAIKNQALNLRRRKDVEARYVRTAGTREIWDNAVIDQEALNILHKAVTELPAKLRAIFIPAFVEGMKIGELSERFGIPERTVKKYKSDIRKFLLKRMGPVFYFMLF
jgi:RNA polymerase sigma-70 factor (ECF subfamily)